MGKIINSNDYALESVKAYIKKEFAEDFITLALESKDKNFIIAQMCIINLAIDYLDANEKRMTPKEAYEKACETFPNVNETLVKTLVSQFSIRGDEFNDWVENPKKWETLWEIEN